MAMTLKTNLPKVLYTEHLKIVTKHVAIDLYVCVYTPCTERLKTVTKHTAIDVRVFMCVVGGGACVRACVRACVCVCVCV